MRVGVEVAGTKPNVSTLSLSFFEQMYADYIRDPLSVSEDWRSYFEEVDGNGQLPPRPSPDQFDRNKPQTLVPAAESRCAICGRAEELSALQHRVDKLIRNYRVRGHRVAQVDPLGTPPPDLPELNPAYHGLDDGHMELRFSTTLLNQEKPLSLREIIARLRETYCRNIGVQFMHIDELTDREWLQKRMEQSCNRIELSRAMQLRILTRLTDAVIFEEFIQKKYVGAKRFSLEGAESLIPLLDLAMERAGEHGLNEIVLAMAHRGRLNVLANIMGKSPRLIFREFEDADPERYLGGGDVKYHLGYHNDWVTQSGQDLHVALCFNPSHLEFVNPVAMGRVRAKQDRLGDEDHERSLTLMIHGDSAFIGEGVVQETLNLSELHPYTTGGTLHIILNNQIGFTTSPEEQRSCIYATEVAKMLQSPIFHVNGEDPEAVAQAVYLAMEYRREFKRDVFVDMYCYRRHGHNETDEPSFTHPVMCRAIEKRPSVRDGYLENLLKLGAVSREEADEIAEKRRRGLEEELSLAREEERPKVSGRRSILGKLWKQYKGGLDKDTDDVDTGVAKDRLAALLSSLAETPPDFTPHPKIKRLLKTRAQQANGEKPLDWAAAEQLAFATVVTDGIRLRMSGQDSARGTFSHRHAILHDHEDGQAYAPLQHLAEDQAPADIHNSPLSEAAVLGFEYGYSCAYPDALVIWEAQFGDFANAAQVQIDQGITSAEDKWGSLSGLVMLLPHGFEGMGPEHSSARLERFLMLASEDNIQVVVPSTPAQFFHVLRRQAVRLWRKPLIVLTPKSLLRHPKVVSDLDDLATGRFQRILPDVQGITGDVDRVLMCSGKVYYDLAEEREKRGANRVAILRVEQLYPLQEDRLAAALNPYPDSTPVFWVQEEPENMGAWLYWRSRFATELLGRWPLRGVFRPGSSSPATGSAAAHRLEQQRLVNAAFEKAP